ncbi:DUF1559 domain-containing protein [Planctomicrobium sp. SH668]|uniref:DUF1559 family PulG-like putative transporter n=1 Tax=Planctomicrobium sp. SH668 TaxID=3448126 RepID=UPI003F5C0BEA
MHAPSLPPTTDDQSPAPRSSGWGWVILVSLIALTVAPIVAYVWGQKVEEKIRWTTREQLITIGQALRQYHEDYNSLPPAFVSNESGTRMHSWRVLILPYLGENELYQEYDFAQPWNSDSNSKLIDKIPKSFRHPRPGKRVGATQTLAIVGDKGAWPGTTPLQYEQVTNTLSNTISIVADPESDVVWTSPDDVSFEEVAGWISESSRGTRTTQYLMLDGSVRVFGRGIPRGQVEKLLSISSP